MDAVEAAVAEHHHHIAAHRAFGDVRHDGIRELVEHSLMLVTALTPHLGYEAAAHIAHRAHTDGTTLKQAALALGLVSADDFDRWVRPKDMLGEP